MFAVFLFVDKPVATLQFDLESPGQVTLASGIDKQIATNRLANGKLRVIIYSLNQSVFQGRFASVDSEIATITNVVGAKADATDAGCTVIKLSQPKNLNAVIKK